MTAHEYRRTIPTHLLGRSGFRTSAVWLGTMTFGEPGGWGATEQECARILDRYAAAGGYVLDTAHYYANGESERIVGRLVKRDRDHWVISTKFGLSDRPADPNGGGGNRKVITRQLEQSLRRMDTDHIDVYWSHAWDALTPIDEVVRALDDLVQAGKILYFGISNAPAWVIAMADSYAKWSDRSHLVAVQAPYNLLERAAERDLLPMARDLGLSAVTWEPLAAGFLTGRFGSNRDLPQGTRIADTPYRDIKVTRRNLVIADRVNEIAAERGVPASQIALAWVLAQNNHTPAIPILGARDHEQLSTALGALDVELTADELARLDEVSRIPLGFPHDSPSRDMPYGNTLAVIDAGSPPQRARVPDKPAVDGPVVPSNGTAEIGFRRAGQPADK